MKSYKNRVAIRVLSVHASVIMLALVIPFLRGCFKQKPKELITFIEFGTPAPAVEITEVPELKNPTLAPEEFITPPDRIPKPPKDTPPPKQPEKKPPKNKAPTLKKPPKRSMVDKIRDSIKNAERVKASPNKPTLTQREIEKTLGGIVTRSPTQRVGNSTSVAAYESTVQRIFYSAWQQPASEGRNPAKVKITIQGNGRIIGRKLIQSSGNSTYDQSVMGAARQVSALPKPPKGYPDRTFTINFKLNH